MLELFYQKPAGMTMRSKAPRKKCSNMNMDMKEKMLQLLPVRKAAVLGDKL